MHIKNKQEAVTTRCGLKYTPCASSDTGRHSTISGQSHCSNIWCWNRQDPPAPVEHIPPTPLTPSPSDYSSSGAESGEGHTQHLQKQVKPLVLFFAERNTSSKKASAEEGVGAHQKNGSKLSWSAPRGTPETSVCSYMRARAHASCSARVSRRGFRALVLFVVCWFAFIVSRHHALGVGGFKKKHQACQLAHLVPHLSRTSPPVLPQLTPVCCMM
jgi:hypothetical protein